MVIPSVHGVRVIVVGAFQSTTHIFVHSTLVGRVAIPWRWEWD